MSRWTAARCAIPVFARAASRGTPANGGTAPCAIAGPREDAVARPTVIKLSPRATKDTMEQRRARNLFAPLNRNTAICLQIVDNFRNKNFLEKSLLAAGLAADFLDQMKGTMGAAIPSACGRERERVRIKINMSIW